MTVGRVELVTVGNELLLGQTVGDGAILAGGSSPRASDLLAKLTDGRLVRVQLKEHGRRADVWTRDGAITSVESLSPAERDQVYLSFSLALLAAVTSQHGIQLPLLLDEPFLRLDSQGMAALAAVLNDLGRRGQQILVFTGQREAAGRLAALGATIHEIHALRHRDGEQRRAAPAQSAAVPTAIRNVITKKAASHRRRAENGKSRKVRRAKPSVGDPTARDQAPNSDAA